MHSARAGSRATRRPIPLPHARMQPLRQRSGLQSHSTHRKPETAEPFDCLSERGSMLTGPEGRRRVAVRAASVSVGNDSASLSGPQAAEGNLRVSQTEWPPGYATRMTNMGKSPLGCASAAISVHDLGTIAWSRPPADRLLRFLYVIILRGGRAAARDLIEAGLS